MAGVIASASGAKAQLRLSPALVPPIPPTCRIGEFASPAGLADVDAIDAIPAKTSIPYFRIVSAGSALVLRGARNDRLAYRIIVDTKLGELTGKTGISCGPRLWRPASGDLVVINRQLPRDSVWRVSLTSPPTAKASRIRILALKDGETKGDDAVPPSSATMFGLMCDDWAPTSSSFERRHSGFAGRVRLDADLPPVGELPDPREREALTVSILEGAALWVKACRDCRSDHLVSVTIGNKQYVRGALARWINSDALTSSSSAIAIEQDLLGRLENSVFLGWPGGVGPRTKTLDAYVPVDAIAGHLSLLCSTPAPTPIAPTLSTVQQTLCSGARLPAGATARILVRFRDNGQTYCGGDAEIIACRADQLLTEFNTRDYRFRLDASSTTILGNGALLLDFLPVLVHEMGHWIGLNHVDRGESIMASSADRARCIDEPTISKLLADQGVQSGPAAFRLHRHGRQTTARR